MGRRGVVLGVMLMGVVLVLAGCGDDDPSKTVDQGAELLAVTFDETGTWETGIFPVGEVPTSTLAIDEGQYQINHRAEDTASFIWGEGALDNSADNVIIDVQVEQLSEEKDNLYGVLCRLGTDSRDNTTGYALLISGDGHYGIAELKSNTLSFLLDWHQTDAINQGVATNTIRAICVEDYLALYVNDTFLGDIKDTMYPNSGPVGLIAGVIEEAAVNIAFDNLTVYEASLSD